ncbi:MAG TPA: hypothetical protein VLT36_22710, partial [Candidatus Dormibacteraeota bacterium]|nr:hypothetical protein [Candidatus Dormibacteraeota bacterium]
LDTMHNRPINAPDYNEFSPQADFHRLTDKEGRLAWTNAPARKLTFDFSADGYMRANEITVQPDGEEHEIKLLSAVVISGCVRDESTGELIPKFRIATGWPQKNFLDGSIGAQFANVDSYWSTHNGGAYKLSLGDPVIYGIDNPGYMLKFEAEGYAPFISRVIAPGEGQIQMDVKLRQAAGTSVTVLGLDGRPVVGADVGLVSKGARLRLIPGGFSRDEGEPHLRVTDDKGQFQLQGDDSITRVVVATDSGYGEATPSQLKASSTLYLLPWGRLEGDYSSGGQPVQSESFILQFPGYDSETLGFDFIRYQAATDSHGHFTFKQAPAGALKLVHLVHVHPNGSQYDPIKDVQIESGKTTSVTLGGSGYTVRAHLQWPRGLSSESAEHLLVSLNTPIPDALMEASKNRATAATLEGSPEVAEYEKTAKHFPMSITGDSTIQANNVPAGDYQIMIVAILKEAKEALMQTAKVTVPADAPSGVVDAGEIALNAPKQSPVTGN